MLAMPVPRRDSVQGTAISALTSTSRSEQRSQQGKSTTAALESPDYKMFQREMARGWLNAEYLEISLTCALVCRILEACQASEENPSITGHRKGPLYSSQRASSLCINLNVYYVPKRIYWG